MKNKHLFFVLLFPLIAAMVGRESAKEYKLDIQLLDSKTNEPLDFINVLISDSSGTLKGAYSEENGKVHFYLPKGSYKLEARMVGYESFTQSFDLKKDTSLIIKLSEETKEISEITIKDHRQKADYRAAPIKAAKSEAFFSSGIIVDAEPAAVSIKEGESASFKSLDNIKSGTLTAGEINDFAKWVLWEDLEKKEFEGYKKEWSLNLSKRFSVQVTFPNHLPVVDAEVQLVNSKNEIEFKARTDNTGKAELWANFEANPQYQESKNYKAYIIYKGETQSLDKLQEAPKELNHISLTRNCEVSNQVDIAFVVDATGSMGDEINYLKSELKDVLERVKVNNSSMVLNTASVFYRDHSDDYLVRNTEFSEDLNKTISFIKAQDAFGGGDFPEAVDAALDLALNKLKWSPEARARLLFLVLDAPPHKQDSVIKSLQKLIYKAAAMGVRIIPVTGSGIDKSVEYLMRSFALATNGTYTFLTDHSGVGGSHIEPSTDSYSVEKLNNLMVRLIDQYLESTGCNYLPSIPNDSAQAKLPKDSSTNQNEPSLTLHCFPVPTSGMLNIHVNRAGGIGFVCDVNGKYVKRFEMKETKKLQEELGQLSNGTYFIRYQVKEEWKSQKIILQH